MKVKFADSFTKSLRRLVWQEGWIYKSYSLFRYDIWRFIANIWRFKKALWNHQWWDYRYSLDMLSTSLTLMEKNLRLHGNEVEESRNKKVAKIQRALELLKNNADDNYIERAEEVLGKLPEWDWEFEDAGNGCSRLVDKDTPEEKEHSKKVFDYARKLEQEEWNELWEIFKGQDNSEYEKYFQENKSKYTDEDEIDYKPYNDWFNGSGMNSWWD
jgi:hypothetical protein